MAESESDNVAPTCCFPHDPTSGAPLLGVSNLTPHPNPRPMTELLPLRKGQLHEDIAQAHPYAFNMGGSRVIPLQDYKEAAEILMERNMPKVLHGHQDKVLFIPDAHLPKEPRVVDIVRFVSRKRKLDEMAEIEGHLVLDQLDMKPGPAKEIQHAKGDLVEKELYKDLKKFYKKATDKETVVYHGPEIRKPGESRALYQESDFVIINKNTKSIYDIESKSTLTGIVAKRAIEQTQKLKQILEEFFAEGFSTKDWIFVGMIYTNTMNTQTPPCAECSKFIINGPTEVANKLDNIEAHLQALRPRSFVPSHPQYVFLVQSLAFVVLSHPISTYCTIASDVHNKVVGRQASLLAKGKAKAKAGQGDFQSIIFWTMQQAEIILTERQFVFFISPWSTGKTLLMREKAVMWATQNPTEKLVFVVVRYDSAKLTSLLEVELKDFFHQQHNLQNVEVLGLPTKPEDTLSCLLTEVTARPPGSSCMVDELVVPGTTDKELMPGGVYVNPENNELAMKNKHEQFTKELEQLQNQFEAQPGKPPL